jgi:hypothetical protein
MLRMGWVAGASAGEDENGEELHGMTLPERVTI